MRIKPYKLEKPLYHGTSNAASIPIIGSPGFRSPVYLTDNKDRAKHYAMAATAYTEKVAKEEGQHLIADGYAIFTFYTLPNPDFLCVDNYSSNEPGQFKYLKSIRGLRHFSVERYPLEVSDEEHLRLQCFAIGMWAWKE